jgi:DNA-binding transcriptional ArsR family regulator
VTSGERTKINDPSVMRALAHPVRLELLEHLASAEDGATATECAAVVGLSPSATSYHLRALAKVGMIEDAPGRGDARERVWRASHRHWAIGADQDATADQAEAEEAMVAAVLARQDDKVRRAMVRIRTATPEWFEVATITDQTLSVTPDELRDMLARIDEIVDPLKRLDRRSAPAGAQPVSFQIRAVPLA